MPPSSDHVQHHGLLAGPAHPMPTVSLAVLSSCPTSQVTPEGVPVPPDCVFSHLPSVRFQCHVIFPTSLSEEVPSAGLCPMGLGSLSSSRPPEVSALCKVPSMSEATSAWSPCALLLLPSGSMPPSPGLSLSDRGPLSPNPQSPTPPAARASCAKLGTDSRRHGSRQLAGG